MVESLIMKVTIQVDFCSIRAIIQFHLLKSEWEEENLYFPQIDPSSNFPIVQISSSFLDSTSEDRSFESWNSESVAMRRRETRERLKESANWIAKQRKGSGSRTRTSITRNEWAFLKSMHDPSVAKDASAFSISFFFWERPSPWARRGRRTFRSTQASNGISLPSSLKNPSFVRITLSGLLRKSLDN